MIVWTIWTRQTIEYTSLICFRTLAICLCPFFIIIRYSKQANDIEEWYQSKSFFDEERSNKINKFVEKNAQLTMF